MKNSLNDTLELKIKKAKERLEETSKEIAEIKKQRDALMVQVAPLDDRIATLQALTDGFKARIDKLSGMKKK